MTRRRVAGRYAPMAFRSGIAVSLLVLTLAALAACTRLRAQPGTDPSPPPAAERTVPPVGAASASDSGAAALNGRLLKMATSSTVRADLPVGPGDLIEVSVFEVEELSKLKLRIPLRGTVTLPLIGEVDAAGRTPIELEQEIRTRLQARYMYDPQVSVFVLEHKSQRISVLGAVKNGGVFNLTGRLRVADGIALAQGLSEDAEQIAYLIRQVPQGSVDQGGPTGTAIDVGSVAFRDAERGPDEAMVAIDLEALASGRSELNMELQSGDILQVPRAGSYYVGGSVERPGSFLLRSKVTVQQAIVAAGGPRDVAAWADIRLYRRKPDGDPSFLTFDLAAFEKGESAPEVQKGDVIVVGKSATKSFFYGILDVFKGVFNFGVGASRGL